jgi:CRISPR-associated protein Cas1
MLSYGYSIFYRNIIGAIERHGLHPYFAFMHKLKFGHAALASDLIEEYRAPLIDKTVLDLVNSREIEVSDFYKNDAGAIYMTKGASKMLTDRFSDIIAKNQKYFCDTGDRKSYGFQVMLDKKILNLIEAIEKRDAGVYLPYHWRPEQ